MSGEILLDVQNLSVRFPVQGGIFLRRGDGMSDADRTFRDH